MANYAADYTTRFWLHYGGPAGDHKMQFRFGTSTSLGDIVTAAQAAADAVGPLISNSATIDSAEYALVGSNLRLALAITPVTGSNGVTYTATQHAAGYFSAPVFASGAGSRCIFYFFYANPLFNQACRFFYADLPSAWGDFETLMTGAFGYTAIDRGALITRGHVDVGINDEITAKQRR